MSANFGGSSGQNGATTAKPSNGAQHKPTILVVEDEVLIRLNTGEFLRDANYRVLEAANAAEAQSILESREPVELVFSDVNMPGEMNGFELAEWIRENFPDVSVLLTSGVSQPMITAREGTESEPVLRKPYSSDTVLAHIKRLLLV